ncbi:MAG: hypothetical protein O7C75_01170 [Verrucomicrobia bacterium]|nr:hypothetical protein [Verrucomicrobiota bacterium]
MNTLSKFSCGKYLFRTPTMILGFVLLLAFGASQAQARFFWRSHHRSLCVQIAYQTYTSDLIGAGADYTLAKAKATNIPDYGDRREAYREANYEYRDARSEARDQLVARLELCESLGGSRYYPEIDPENFCTPEEIAANPNPCLY